MTMQWLASVVDVTPGSIGAWVDIDVSGHVSAQATGVIVRVSNAAAGRRSYGIRKNGSTDSLEDDIAAASQQWDFCGIDGVGLLEAYVDTGITLELVGYFADEAVFFTNAVNKGRPNADNSWEDCDISGDTGADTAIAAVGLAHMPGNTTQSGQRKNGSTDNLSDTCDRRNTWIVGVDAGEIFEFRASTVANVTWYLTGYLKADWIFHTNGIDATPASTATWTDHTLDDPAAIAGVIYSASGSSASDYGARRNGAPLDWRGDHSLRRGFAVVEADAGGIIETYAESATTSQYELGYASPPAGGTAALPTGVSSAAIAGEVGTRADVDIVAAGVTATGAAGLAIAGIGAVHGGVALTGIPLVAGTGSIAAGNPWAPRPGSSKGWPSAPMPAGSWSDADPAMGDWI